MDNNLELFDVSDWNSSFPVEIQQKAVKALENGKVLYFPHLGFPMSFEERQFLSPGILNKKAKNISYTKATHSLKGSLYEGKTADQLRDMIERYADSTSRFLQQLIPLYAENVKLGKTSFRPAEVQGRKISSRKDDTLLHVDAFPSNPTQGQRLLRVFTNVNPDGKPRIWRVGEPLDQVLNRFLPKTRGSFWGTATILKALGITKSYRTPYDHYMLQIHDRMKEDKHYQETVSFEEIAFPPGASWMVYTDQVSHAAMSGQHLLEQTFYMPVQGQAEPATAPLRRLERFLDKALI